MVPLTEGASVPVDVGGDLPSAHLYIDYDPASGQILATHHRTGGHTLPVGAIDATIYRLELPIGTVLHPGTHRVDAGGPAPVLIDHDPDAIAAHADQQAWAALRATRDWLLATSDVRGMPDRWAGMSPAQQAAWAAYRQALRDLPSITTDPTNPPWPADPSRSHTEE